MPGLPEIEAIKRVIEPQIRGLAIEQVTVRRPDRKKSTPTLCFGCQTAGSCGFPIRAGSVFGHTGCIHT